MDDAFVGEIRLMALAYQPEDWLPCDGRRVPISEFQALYAIIGNAFGGDGRTYFSLPDLCGRAAVGSGDDPTDPFHPPLAEKGGASSVALTSNDLPPHGHMLSAGNLGAKLRSATAKDNWIGSATFVPNSGALEGAFTFVEPNSKSNPVALAKGTLASYPGAGGAHENRQPYLALQYFICWNGYFPIHERYRDPRTAPVETLEV